MPIQAILADDHLSVREGLKLLLEGEREYEIVGEADNGQEAIRLSRELHPNLAILDFAMPLLNGLDAARCIRRESPETRLILLTAYEQEEYVLSALKAGVRGYLLKTLPPADLLKAIRVVLRGGIYISPSISQTVIESFLARNDSCEDELSLRERQVLQLVAEGKHSKEVACLLGCSVRTVESHRARIMKKLGIHETAGLVRYAIRQGIVHP